MQMEAMKQLEGEVTSEAREPVVVGEIRAVIVNCLSVEDGEQSLTFLYRAFDLP